MRLLRAWLAIIRAEVGREELLLALGLVLVTIALWPVFAQGALIVPGTALIWIAMPTRRSFVETPRPTDDHKPRRKP